MKLIETKNIDGVPVRVEIIPKGNYKIRPQFKMNPKYITIHNTANERKYADADAHKRLLHRYSTDPFAPYASYHLVIDAKEAIQLLPFDESAWASGDGSGVNSGNRTSIQIEICENADMDYEKAEANAVKIILYLMEKLDIPHSNVVSHQKWSGKNCPRKILNRDGGWKEFHKNLLNETPVKETTSKPSSPSTIELKPYTVKDGDTLWDISQKHNTTVSKIKKDNNLEDDTIFPGEVLMVKDNDSAPKKVNENTDEYAGKRVESKVSSLKFYSKPSWEDKDVMGIVEKGHGFDIVEKVKVGKGNQFKVKNSKGKTYYITANEKYVKIL